MSNYDKLMEYLDSLVGEPCYNGLMKFHYEHEALIRKAKGSKSKHQAWDGGYVDHLVECLEIASKMFDSLGKIRQVPVEWNSVVKVLYLHDVEKMFKYSDLPHPNPGLAKDAIHAKDWFYGHWLKESYGVVLSDEERNALDNIHGEKEYGEHRVAGRLAAFCHCCDMLSARMWFDKPYRAKS